MILSSVISSWQLPLGLVIGDCVVDLRHLEDLPLLRHGLDQVGQRQGNESSGKQVKFHVGDNPFELKLSDFFLGHRLLILWYHL